MSETNSPSTNGQSKTQTGRDSSGRFTAGNKGGPGNPFARQTAARRKAIVEAVSEEQLAAIMATMVQKATEGDVDAAKLVFAYAVGKPAAPADPDTLDAHELAVRRGSTASPDDMKALFAACPAWLLCAIAAIATPKVQEHLQEVFAQGVLRQDEMDQKGQKTRPDDPGPYQGRKADWAPASVTRGISDEVSEVFEACPAWMPDINGSDRLPHVFADVLRSMRRSLLDELPRSKDDPRPSATSADSKRDKRPKAATGT